MTNESREKFIADLTSRAGEAIRYLVEGHGPGHTVTIPASPLDGSFYQLEVSIK